MFYIGVRLTGEPLELPDLVQVEQLGAVMVFGQRDLRMVERILTLMLEHLPESDESYEPIKSVRDAVQRNLPAR